MVVITATVVLCVLTAIAIGVEAYGIYQDHQDAGETIEAMDAVSQGLDKFVEEVVQAVESLADVIIDAAKAIMQYMDAWGTVIVVLFAVVIVILLAMFFNVAIIRRSR